ncbi:MAG: hypothetical protein FJX25_04180 [Alphaproteobacteria bacterium]|nr:hypothetical protein [Alphaproteobacteria bacterium]
MFKLESFSTAVAAREVEETFTRQDLDQAYADGFAQAQALAEDAALRSLIEGLEQLSRSLADDEDRRRSLRQEAVDALAPILTQIVDLMAPPLTSRRLEDALRDELARLAARGTALAAQITCSEPLRALVDRCLADTGLSGITINPSPADQITVSLQGGRIELTPDTIARDIRAVLEELSEDTETWTH